MPPRVQAKFPTANYIDCPSPIDCITYLKEDKCQLYADDELMLKYWLTANGLSYGRMLDNNKDLALFSEKEINKTNSRRVEFKILTRSEELIEQVIKQLK